MVSQGSMPSSLEKPHPPTQSFRIIQRIVGRDDDHERYCGPRGAAGFITAVSDDTFLLSYLSGRNLCDISICLKLHVRSNPVLRLTRCSQCFSIHEFLKGLRRIKRGKRVACKKSTKCPTGTNKKTANTKGAQEQR